MDWDKWIHETSMGVTKHHLGVVWPYTSYLNTQVWSWKNALNQWIEINEFMRPPWVLLNIIKVLCDPILLILTPKCEVERTLWKYLYHPPLYCDWKTICVYWRGQLRRLKLWLTEDNYKGFLSSPPSTLLIELFHSLR